LYVVMYRPLRRADPWSIAVLPSVYVCVSLRVIRRYDNLYTCNEWVEEVRLKKKLICVISRCNHTTYLPSRVNELEYSKLVYTRGFNCWQARKSCEKADHLLVTVSLELLDLI